MIRIRCLQLLQIRRVTLAAALLLGLTVAFTASDATAQGAAEPPGGGGFQKPPPIRTDLKFDSTDAIRGHIAEHRSDFFVGEPVVIPIVLVNHMQHPITLRTNFNPRGNLVVTIQRENQAPQPYYGPYKLAIYAPLDIKMDPMEQLDRQLLIWGDGNSDSGLALPEPGTYTVSISIKLEVPEAKFIDQPTFPPFQLRVLATPPALAPLVTELRGWRGFIPLQLKVPPEGHEERLMELIQQYPNNPLTPYMCYAAYKELLRQYNLHPEDKTLADRMLYYLQIAVVPETSFQIEALNELLSIFDQMNLSIPAWSTATRILQVMPRDLQGLVGNSKLMQKYLINSKELKTEQYWSILDDYKPAAGGNAGAAPK